MRVDPTDREFLTACLDRARRGPEELREICRDLTEEDARRKPGVGKLSVVEHVCHLRDMEREVFGVRLRRVLAEENPRLDPVDQEHYVDEARWAGRTFRDLFAEWAAARAENVTLVEGAGPGEWARPVRHPDLGNATFADVVARWSRHDAEHFLQIEIIARNCRERNLR